MKLFCIRLASSKKPIPGLYFSDKPSAKKERDALTAATSQPHVVTYGPDHRKFQG